MEIQPSRKKILAYYAMWVILIAGGIIGFIIFVITTIPIDAVTEGFDAIGIELEGPKIGPQVIGLGTVVALFVFLIVFGTKFDRYEFNPEEVVHFKNFFFANTGQEEIHYTNVATVTYEKSFLGTGTINLGLTGLEKDKYSIKFINNPAEASKQIQSLINEARQREYANYAQQQRYDQIVNRQ